MPSKKSLSKIWTYAEDFRGKRFYCVGDFSHWPNNILDRSAPDKHIKQRGGTIVKKLDENTDFLVVGRGRKKGKAALLRQAEAMCQQNDRLRILHEQEFLYLARPDITGLSFAFIGDFAQSLGETDSPSALAAAHGAIVREDLTSELDFVVIGERRVKGKAAALRQLATLRQNGATFTEINEDEYLALLLCLTKPGASTADVPILVLQLRNLVDSRRVDRALRMLKKDAFQLYAEHDVDHLAGIVRSQSDANSYYSCSIKSDGSYSCYSQDMGTCGGLQGRVCKHLMVLLIGMSKNGDLSPATALAWVEAAHKQRPAKDEEIGARTLLRYRGVQAGELDWRPTETVPEDYYTL